ncbi:winged helix-turn-helix domain-containing protein [Patescibacteria group bacterium]|nr:winged helix-turn-helix domain-containing protein [Patescibacteria group bacterium]MCL5010121.1 winged helix-turn-helix domain-containing protein [Patescibacteria group bacterium]
MKNVRFESLYPANSRFKETEKIFDYIKKGFSCQIIGLPGIGKSNLLKLLAYNRNVRIKHAGQNQKWFHFVYLDLSEIKHASFFDMEKYVFLELADSLRDRNLLKEHDQIHKIFNQHVKFQDDLVLFQGLKEALNFLAIQKELTVILMFDKLEASMTFLTDRFFSNLKTLRNLAKYRFSCVFSAARLIEEMLEVSVYQDFLEFFRDKTVYLSIFDRPSLDFRISYLEKISGRKIVRQILDGVISLTAGHGKLTRICLEELVSKSASDDGRLNASEAMTPPRRTFEELRNFLLEQKPVIDVLREIWQALTAEEQKILSASEAAEWTPRKCRDTSDGTEDIRASTPPGRTFEEEKKIEFLTKIGLLKNDRFAMPLLAEFIKNQAAGKQLGNPSIEDTGETIVFDQAKNEIKKGEAVISDNLTALEFRLLKFLIANPGKTMERAEIINAIWQETASTAGVTDQAFDQLIFRLRKKIESDPNSPRHIETVKGRGIRFNP